MFLRTTLYTYTVGTAHHIAKGVFVQRIAVFGWQMLYLEWLLLKPTAQQAFHCFGRAFFKDLEPENEFPSQTDFKVQLCNLYLPINYMELVFASLLHMFTWEYLDLRGGVMIKGRLILRSSLCQDQLTSFISCSSRIA